MKKSPLDQKRFAEETGKLHIPCPHRDKSGVGIFVVIKNGQCYRSDVCMVIECKYNTIQNDLEKVLSVTW